eukprot:TRINITY_DN2398_c0_g1_i2.p1 TRINITY_DN2398_c0_g1~~TRINITY_DN2398_c0_g1_i2.p1  ORF type:complete len:478 (+),score=173.21 TRINITY_DN2398_c0_g1_i2:45-1478(+)
MGRSVAHSMQAEPHSPPAVAMDEVEVPVAASSGEEARRWVRGEDAESACGLSRSSSDDQTGKEEEEEKPVEALCVSREAVNWADYDEESIGQQSPLAADGDLPRLLPLRHTAETPVADHSQAWSPASPREHPHTAVLPEPSDNGFVRATSSEEAPEATHYEYPQDYHPQYPQYEQPEQYEHMHYECYPHEQAGYAEDGYGAGYPSPAPPGHDAEWHAAAMYYPQYGEDGHYDVPPHAVQPPQYEYEHGHGYGDDGHYDNAPHGEGWYPAAEEAAPAPHPPTPPQAPQAPSSAALSTSPASEELSVPPAPAAAEAATPPLRPLGSSAAYDDDDDDDDFTIVPAEMMDPADLPQERPAGRGQKGVKQQYRKQPGARGGKVAGGKKGTGKAAPATPEPAQPSRSAKHHPAQAPGGKGAKKSKIVMHSVPEEWAEPAPWRQQGGARPSPAAPRSSRPVAQQRAPPAAAAQRSPASWRHGAY